MDNAKKERTKKHGILKRRMTELRNSMKTNAHVPDIERRLGTLTDAMEVVGSCHDEVMAVVPTEEVQTEESWYEKLDCDVNIMIAEARSYVDNANEMKEKKEKKQSPQFKLKEIEMPCFHSDHRAYHKWKDSSTATQNTLMMR